MKIKNLFFIVAIIFSCITVSIAQNIPNYVPTDGLVGWWPFNGSANDQSGNGNNGVVNGAITTTDRKGNNNSAYYFSGDNCSTYIDAQINTSKINSELTISFWVNRSDNGCISPRIMKFLAPSDGPGTHVFNWVNNNNKPSMSFVTSISNNYSYQYDNIENQTWAFLVYTNDGKNAKLYQNGMLLSSNIVSGNVSLAGNATFGRMTNPAHDAFNGKIDDIGIWSRVLTNQEIMDLYKSEEIPNYIPVDGLIGWWPFNGNASDKSGNNLHGDVIGATLTTNLNGNSNSAYNFDFEEATFSKQNNEVYIPFNSLLNVSNITVSTWVYPRSYYWSGNSNDPRSTIIRRFQYTYSNPFGGAWGIDYFANKIEAFIIDENKNSLVVTYNTPLTLNDWSNISFSYNGTILNLYLNGVLVNSNSGSINLNVSGNSGISIGESNQANGYWYYVDGIIDDIGIWNRSLTQQEITNIYQGVTLSLVDLIDDSLISIFPNPTRDYLKIKLSEQMSNSTIELFNVTGKKVLSKPIKSNQNIDLSLLAPAIYFYKIKERGIIKKRGKIIKH